MTDEAAWLEPWKFKEDHLQAPEKRGGKSKDLSGFWSASNIAFVFMSG